MRGLSLRRGSIILAGLGLIALTGALITLPNAAGNQPSALAPEHAAVITSPIAAQPTLAERDALEPRSLGYVEFDWDTANRVPGFKVN